MEAYAETQVGKKIMIAVLLLILVPLAALPIWAVVFDLRQRRLRGAASRHEINQTGRVRTRRPSEAATPPAASPAESAAFSS